MAERRNLTRLRLAHLNIDFDFAICSVCGGPNDREPQRYCKACHAEYQRIWRSGRLTVPRETMVGATVQPPCLVYVIEEIGGKFCKVGIAGNIKDRLTQLQTGNGRRLAVAGQWWVSSRLIAATVEKTVLHAYADRCACGEWLHVSSEELSAFVAGLVPAPPLIAEAQYG